MLEPLDLIPFEGAPALDLNELLATDPSATMFIKIRSKKLGGMGLDEGDMLIIDKLTKPRTNSIVLAVYKGEWLLRRISKNTKGLIMLSAETDSIAPITVLNRPDLEICGVVTHSIKVLYQPNK